MKLYLLTTIGLGDFYVISNTSSQAEDILINALNKADYGFRYERIIKNIKIITGEVTNFPQDIPNFSTENRLLISK